MRNRYVSLISFLVVVTIAAFLNYTEISAGKDKNPTLNAKIDLEDSIIIRAIKMETESHENSDKGENTGGKIIYNEEFHNSLPGRKNLQKKRRGKKRKGKTTLFEKLKKKDIRWHITRYRIKKNDNLWNIARKFGINYNLIIDINKINDPDRLLPGKYLDIPNRNGVFYKIKRGDTLGKISRMFGVKKSKLTPFKREKKGLLKTGYKLFIPDAALKKGKTNKLRSFHRRKVASGKRIKFMWPIKGKLTSGFGNRIDPISGKRQFHCGIDISAHIGKKIRSSAKGRVIFSGWKKGYGKVVIIRHSKGYITVYAHNSRNLVKKMDRVGAGEVIAQAGNTGAVTGAHLHFEIRKYVTPLNPLRLFRQRI